MKADQWLPGDGHGDGRDGRREITKRFQEASEVDRYIHYLDRGDDFTGVFICQEL